MCRFWTPSYALPLPPTCPPPAGRPFCCRVCLPPPSRTESPGGPAEQGLFHMFCQIKVQVLLGSVVDFLGLWIAVSLRSAFWCCCLLFPAVGAQGPTASIRPSASDVPEGFVAALRLARSGGRSARVGARRGSTDQWTDRGGFGVLCMCMCCIKQKREGGGAAQGAGKYGLTCGCKRSQSECEHRVRHAYRMAVPTARRRGHDAEASTEDPPQS